MVASPRKKEKKSVEIMAAKRNSSIADHYPALSGSDDDFDGMSSNDFEVKEEEEEEYSEEEAKKHNLGREVRSYQGSTPKRLKIDRISKLPDNVILRILSFMTVKQIVRTGTLSKRFQNLWPSVSTLEFDYPGLSNNSKFVAFVCKTLILCDSPSIKKFWVGLHYKKSFESDVNIWLRFATRKNVEDLLLNFLPYKLPSDIYHLPEHLYTNSSLTKLTLLYCDIKPKGVISWISLRNLSIEFAELRDDTVEKILSGCPVLESLLFHNCHGMNCLDVNSASLRKLMIHGYRNPMNEEEGSVSSVLEVSAPNIRSLVISGCFFYKKCWLLDVSSLVDVELNFYQSPSHDGEGNDDDISGPLIEALEKLRHVENLKLGHKCIEVISIMEVIGLWSPLSKRKCLTLDVHITKWSLPGIASLLENSPVLDTLIIKRPHSSPQPDEFFLEYFSNSFNFDGEKYWASITRSFKCLELNIKTVKIVDFAFVGGESGFELQFVQFLLQNARALEKMVINAPRVGQKQYSACCTSHASLQVTQSLLSFPRSSQHAVIIFT